jgi:pyruvate,water dikinase
VEGNADALRKMIGLIRGRVYYNMGSWYRALALLPGYSLNRPFMEQMMGVREPVPDALSVAPATGRVRALWDVARASLGLLREHWHIDRSVRRFHARVEQSLVIGDIPLEDMRADELVSHYRALESRLLARWDAPLANDFFAMVHFGVLRTLAARWCGDADGTLPNDLVAGEGGMISAEPARAIRRMSTLVATIPGLPTTLAMAEREPAMSALRSSAALAEEFSDYIARFGDRCAGELKLETLTLSEDPMPLIRAIGEGALSVAQATEGGARAIRERAESRVRGAMHWRPLRRMIFNAVLRRARARVRDRENLRFERTRVFGRVRQIVLELGRRFTAARLLDDPRDVFFLEIHEVLGAVEGTTTSAGLRSLANTRRAEFEQYLDHPAPGERFETHGMVHEGNRFVAGRPLQVLEAESLDTRRGTGCYPGHVRGTVRVVLDPHDSQFRSGEILVAERTDPGWIMLFPRAAGILVERGSLLSHSAIVSRELGIPSVVAIAGLTSWLRTGDVVELDGRSGVVRVIELARETSEELDHDE